MENDSYRLISADEICSILQSVSIIEIDGPDTVQINDVEIYQAFLYDCYDQKKDCSVVWHVSGGVSNWRVKGNILAFTTYKTGLYTIKATCAGKSKEKEINVMGILRKVNEEQKDISDVVKETTSEKVTITERNAEKADSTPTKRSIYKEPAFAEREVSYEERQEKVSQKKQFWYRTSVLFDPFGNADSYFSGGSYATVALAAQALEKGDYKQAIIYLVLSMALIVGKHCVEKGPLAQKLEFRAKKTRSKYDNVENTIIS